MTLKKHSVLRNQKGDTLVSVLVSAVILFTVALSFMSISEYSSKGRLGLVTSMEFQEARLSTMMVLSNQTLCNAVFASKEIDLSAETNMIPTFQEIEINDQKLVPRPGQKRLKDITFRVDKRGGLIDFGGTKRIQLVDVWIRAEKSKVSFGPSQFQKKIPLSLIVETATTPATVLSCFSEECGGCPPPPEPPPPPPPSTSCFDSTLNVSFTSPSDNPHSFEPGGFIYPTDPTSIPLQFKAEGCENPASATARVIIQGGFPPILTSGLGPSNTDGTTAEFEYSLSHEKPTTAPGSVVTVEVTCNGSDMGCAKKTFIRQEICPEGFKGLGDGTQIRNFSHCSNCVWTGDEISTVCIPACAGGSGSFVTWMDGPAGDCNGIASNNCPGCP